jgi:hypothetical protein
MTRWLLAFLFTQLVEVPIYMKGGRARFPEAFGASALTHPIVWFVIPWAWEATYRSFFAPHPSLQLSSLARYWIMVAIAETFAIVAEGFYMRWLGRPRPFLWSLVANMSSVTLGFTSRHLFGVP